MPIIKNNLECKNIDNNEIIEKINLDNSEIEFKGINNILFCNGELNLKILNYDL